MRTPLALLLITFMLAGCDRPAQDSTPQSSQPATEAPTHEARSENWPQELLQDAQQAHQALQEATDQLARQVNAFLAEPGNDSHKAARDAWRTAHQAYKAVRIYQLLKLAPLEEAPIPQAEVQHSLRSRLDLYPLEPGYLDRVEGYPFSGLVFSESVPITLDSLNEQHQFSDPNYVVFGFHPLEFLLWGESHSQQTRRSWHDFKRPPGESAPPQADDQATTEQGTAKLRRRQLLALITQKLAEDVAILAQAWQPGGHYPSQFLTLPPQEQYRRAHRAVIQVLDQEVSAPLQAALIAAKQQEAWQPESTFSQNSRGDLLASLNSVTKILPLFVTESQQDLVSQLSQLQAEASKIKGPLFDASLPPQAEHLEQLVKAQALTIALLKQLSARPAP